jgi:hypothetical protein
LPDIERNYRMKLIIQIVLALIIFVTLPITFPIFVALGLFLGIEIIPIFAELTSHLYNFNF